MTDIIVPATNPPFNMAQYCIGRAAASWPDATALMVISQVGAPPSEVLTYAALEDAVLKIASGLQRLDIEPGARILIRLDNTSVYALLFFGAIAGGFVPIATSSQLTEKEVLFLLEDSGASAMAVAPHLAINATLDGVLVFGPATIEAMIAGNDHTRGKYAPTRAEDPAFLVYTSGTTASPKGVLHAQRTVLGRRPTIEVWYDLTHADRMLHAGALNWTYTLGTGLADPWAAGATAIIYTGEKDPAFWPRLIAGTGATMFAAVPGVFRQILKYGAPSPDNLGRLRHGLMAGESPPSGLIEAWEAATGRPLYEALGMSEISTYVSTGPDVPRKPGTTGKPQKGRRIAILPAEGGEQPLPPGQDGIIAVHRSDPGLMLGYWNRPNEETEIYRGEWFVGGDIGRIDEDGYLTHVGRVNDIMKALGYRVSPLEVEAVLAHCPGVAEVACTEVQVRADVSVIGAFVVPMPASAATAEDILAYAAERLAPYKCPRQVVFVDALPRTPNGKVKRSGLAMLVPARE